MSQQPDDTTRILLERDLYAGLLRLGKLKEARRLLEQALELVVELTGARQAYLELSVDTSAGETRSWSAAHACASAEIDAIRGVVSRGIVAEAIASGRTVHTPSALLDPRFDQRVSVRSHHIESVLCVPIGRELPPLGVLYLEGHRGAGPFSDASCQLVELFSEHVAPVAERLLTREVEERAPDPIAELRGRLRCDGFLGRSRAFADTLRQAALVAPLDVHVLLTGASGTGKTQIAHILHNSGPRAAHPFVELNCAAIPESLMESELFGVTAGAFTDAAKMRSGKIASAAKGTLFLDEIGELPMSAQAKLLQFLQSKRYSLLGSTQVLQADVRIIAATNTDLRAAVLERRFREDLLYRLEVVPIRLPSLAERTDDIDDLVDHFCEQSVSRHRLSCMTISPGCRRAIKAASWPGNLRQLEHAVEAAAIRAAGDNATAIEVRHVFPHLVPEGSTDSAEADLTFQEATRQFQADLLLRTLVECDWNVTECARRLDLARSHVYNLIGAFGLERKSA